MTRKADLPSSHGTGIAALIGLALVVVILAGSAFLVFRGFTASGTDASSPTTTPTGVIAANPTIRPTEGLPVAPTAAPSGGPVSSTDPVGPGESPAATPRRTLRPDPTPTPPAAEEVGQATGWTCETGSIVDDSRSTWRIRRVDWADRARFDQLTLTLVRESGRARPGTTARLEWLAPSRVERRFGLPEPSGDRALAIGFDGPVSVRERITADEPNELRAVRSILIGMDENQVARVVIGVDGAGCARIAAPDWTPGSSGDEVELTIDVRYD
jgi:hypothetical protein